MENMKYPKSKLLEILKENRGKHRQIFEEACEGFKKRAVELLEEKLTLARKGDRVIMQFSLQQPVDQTKEYDRAIKMLELCIPAEIELDESDFANYVMDDWAWKQQFLTSNSSYSGTAAAMLAR
jgi:hypothetical protein